MVAMKEAILAIVTIVVLLILASAIVPGAITTISNTSAITGYSTWTAGAQSMWSVIALFAVLCILLIFVGIALSVIG
jgi:hypothetical protein